MKKLFLLITTVLTLSCLGSSVPASASTNDFYFESADFSYFLDRDDAGASVMTATETLTAVFPEFDQNHGIERCIPRLYNHVDTLEKTIFSVSRNGESEPFSVSTDGDYLCLRIGSASSYVHGSQIYEISYTLRNVIQKPDDFNVQELYWDTNGTGWSQTFNRLTASVTLSDSLKSAWKNTAYCYVGKYGTSGSAATSRCEIEKTDSTVSFSTTSDSVVRPTETMTIDLEFAPDTFSIKEPEKSYFLLILLGALGVFVLFAIFAWIKAFSAVRAKRNLAKSKITSPEFTPKLGFTVGEMAQNYLKTLKNPRVASLLELAVSHKIELQKGDKKTFGGFKWKILVKNLDGVSEEQRIVLEILNGGSSVSAGETIEVKSYVSTARLRQLDASYNLALERHLEDKGLFIKEKERKKSGLALISVFFALFFIFCFVFVGIIADSLQDSGKVIVGLDFALPLLFVGCFLFLFVHILVSSSISKYNKRTMDGIKASKYLDGMKRYMKLAEKDRINFLQSVKGADTSNEGIVKLYEKLLPYAVLFGIEESWMKELNAYYKLDDVSDPDWMMRGMILSASDFRSFTSSTSSSIASSTASQSSSSSGGGGGGGFSGGGGGGGGGGGW